MNSEFNFVSVITRAKEIFGCSADNALADVLGMKPAAFGNRKKIASIPYEHIVTAATERGADLTYILTGTRSVDRIAERLPEYSNSEFAEIPHYNVQAAAGHGKVAGDEETLKPLAFRRDWLAERRLSPNALAIVGVSGDSQLPALHDGDLVLVDLSQNQISNGKTYVLRLDGHLLIKNLQILPQQGLIQVASFNPGFPPYTVDLADQSIDIAVIGRVVASMHEWR